MKAFIRVIIPLILLAVVFISCDTNTNTNQNDDRPAVNPNYTSSGPQPELISSSHSDCLGPGGAVRNEGTASELESDFSRDGSSEVMIRDGNIIHINYNTVENCCIDGFDISMEYIEVEKTINVIYTVVPQLNDDGEPILCRCECTYAIRAEVKLPEAAGEYTVQLYEEDYKVHSEDFTVE